LLSQVPPASADVRWDGQKWTCYRKYRQLPRMSAGMDKNRLAIASTASFRGCPLGWTKIQNTENCQNKISDIFSTIDLKWKDFSKKKNVK